MVFQTPTRCSTFQPHTHTQNLFSFHFIFDRFFNFPIFFCLFLTVCLSVNCQSQVLLHFINILCKWNHSFTFKLIMSQWDRYCHFAVTFLSKMNYLHGQNMADISHCNFKKPVNRSLSGITCTCLFNFKWRKVIIRCETLFILKITKQLQWVFNGFWCY